MSKSYELEDVNVQKFYIVTRPTRLSDLQLDDIESEPTSHAVKRGRRLRERRMARIRNQLD